MTYITNKDFLIEVAKGNVPGHELITKFGRSAAVPAAFAPLSFGGNYRTPQVGALTALRIKAGGNANDDAAGSGAREITIEVLDQTGALQTEVLATAGASASADTSIAVLRLNGWYVSKSGTYATQSAGSHAADIELEDTGANSWSIIDATGFPKGQSQIGCYTVPLGKKAYLLDYSLTVDSGKSIDAVFFKRENILQTSAPYDAMRTVLEHAGIVDKISEEIPGAIEFNELTDIGWMVQGASTPKADVTFRILLVDQ